MIYGLICTQKDKFVSTRHITHLSIKHEDINDIWKIRAHLGKGKKVTLGKYVDRECAEVVYESVSLYLGQNIYDYDHEFELLKTREDMCPAPLGLFSKKKDDPSFCRLYMPEEEKVQEYLMTCQVKHINPYITDRYVSRYESLHPHAKIMTSQSWDGKISEGTIKQGNKKIIQRL